MENKASILKDKAPDVAKVQEVVKSSLVQPKTDNNGTSLANVAKPMPKSLPAVKELKKKLNDDSQGKKDEKTV